MKPNYRAWDLITDDFSGQRSLRDKIIFFLRFAVLAPSGHNTQPWNFSVSDGAASLRVNRERSLEGSDPQRRQLLIAFGCMIENLMIAASHYGYAPDIHYFPEPQDPDLVATVAFKEQRDDGKKGDGDLVSAIPLRHTNRGTYIDRSLPHAFVERIKRYADEGLEVHVITDRERRNSIADIVNEAAIEIMDDGGFREELSHYIRSSYTREHTGMPGFALEIPGPISLIASPLIKKTNLSRSSQKKDIALLKEHTPGGFVVIASRKDDAAGRLASGRLFEKIWLTAAAEGLDCSPMAAAIQSPRHNARLKQVLRTEFDPQVFFRIGYGEKAFHHSPRFTVEQLLIPS